MSSSQIPSLESQRRFWNWHWQNWEERKTINEWKIKRHEVVLDFLRSLPLDNARILDLGCGPGKFTEKLADFGEVTGIDISDEAIAMAKARLPHLKFVAGNLYEVPLPYEHFDVVVSQEVIDHVQDPAELVRRAATVLKPEGYLILSCANRFVMERLGDGEFPTQPPDHIAHYLGTGDLKRLLKQDFDLVRKRSILPTVGGRGLLRFTNSHKLNTMIGILIPRKHLESLKERAGLGYQLIVLAQKKT